MNDASPAVTARPPVDRRVVLAAFAVSGAAALTYEVVWTRALSVILGSTTYAVSSMLATFMLGLALGGIAGGRIADRRAPLRLFAFAELGIGLLGIASHLVIEALPSAYLAIYRALHLSAPAYFAAQIGLCSLVMLAPTILMGTTFPLVARAVVGRVEDVGRSVGLAYGLNTLGAVVGSLVTGFLLVPALGLRGSTLVAAGANVLVATVILASARGARSGVVALLLGAYLPVGAWTLSTDRGSRLVNFYSAHHLLDLPDVAAADVMTHVGLEKLFEREGRDGYVAAYRDPTGHLLLQVGGKIEGTTEEDRANTELLSYLPLAAHRDPRTMLVIGLGAGVTLDVARRSLSDVTLAEINGDVLEAVRRHGPPRLLDAVRVVRDDARNLLLRTEERWDVISSEPSYPTDFAVSNLFSREFYALAAERLSPDGVFCQWLPYYMLTNDDVTMMVKTFASVFPEATLWKVQGSMDLLLLGSRSPFARRERAIRERVTALSGGEPLEYQLSRDDQQVRDIARDDSVPLNTDDRPRLEFDVARNLRVADLALLERR